MPTIDEDGDDDAIKKAVAELIVDGSPSHASASHAVNAPFLAMSDDDSLWRPPEILHLLVLLVVILFFRRLLQARCLLRQIFAVILALHC